MVAHGEIETLKILLASHKIGLDLSCYFLKNIHIYDMPYYLKSKRKMGRLCFKHQGSISYLWAHQG